jgi:hypothetical protein
MLVHENYAIALKNMGCTTLVIERNVSIVQDYLNFIEYQKNFVEKKQCTKRK